MANPDAIVSMDVRLEPALEQTPPEEALKAPDGLAIVVDGERRIGLDPGDPRSPGLARVIDGASRQHLPLYFEVDPSSGTLTRLLLPQVGRVVAISAAEGVLDVRLDTSHARRTLHLDAQDAAEIERELRAVLGSPTAVLVVEDDRHEIIDVREYTPDPEGPPLPPFPPEPGLPPIPRPVPRWPFGWLWWLVDRLWWWIRYPWYWFRCASPTRAQQVFDAMAATSCDPLTVPSPCIPFLYPDDGCWARAHEMCRLMLGMGITPRKVWIDASSYLHVATRNNPACFVDWGWHVAPTICVRGRWFLTERRVIDPSLFTTPVTEATWKGVQGDPNATLTDTDWTRFWHGGGTDPAYVQTNQILAQYRSALQLRSVQIGPPPYANCP